MDGIKFYDYIFAGGGLSTLLLVDELLKTKQFAEKTMLILEPEHKNTNDRTWSFWEQGKGQFDELTIQSWDFALFASAGFRKTCDLKPYRYKTIESSAFYRKLSNRISKSGIVTFAHERLLNYTESADGVVVQSSESVYNCKKFLSSVFDPKFVSKQNAYPLIWQHFIGWKIKTTAPSFDPNSVTFMDFDLPQNGNTRFMYVLPFSNTEALFEFTYFSEKIEPDDVYTDAIMQYLAVRNIGDYAIYETEKGAIPMSSFPFWKQNTKNVGFIGSAGGWTKASTGFTFMSSRKKAHELARKINENFDFTKLNYQNRFWFYDLLFVDVLYRQNEIGSEIFAAMFKKLPAHLILKFLDEETTFSEECRILWSCPKLPFVKALLRNLPALFRISKLK